MLRTLPGTMLPLFPHAEQDAFKSLAPIFAVSGGGLLLSQVVELTGLSASTIQNWVKRGWISKPVGKKYDEIQVARILLINLLRPAMQLENIVTLLATINGRVDDRSDDIIAEPRLYSMLCSAIGELEKNENFSHEAIITLTKSRLEGYEGPVPDAAQRLTNALSVMLMNVAASMLMQCANELYCQIVAPVIPSPAD